MEDPIEGLRGGVVLAELGGYGDGAYCARHGRGASLVKLGTYIVDPGSEVPYHPRFVFPPDRGSYAEYLRENISAARASGALVGVSVVSIELADTLEFLRTAQENGADFLSLCAHSTMEMFVRAGTSSALCAERNWERLREWARAILAFARVPVIFKVGAEDTPDSIRAVGEIAKAGIPVVHINVGATDPGSPGLRILEGLRGACPLLIASGGIREIGNARAALQAGADAIAIGSAAMHDAGLCGRIRSALSG